MKCAKRRKQNWFDKWIWGRFEPNFVCDVDRVRGGVASLNSSKAIVQRSGSRVWDQDRRPCERTPRCPVRRISRILCRNLHNDTIRLSDVVPYWDVSTNGICVVQRDSISSIIPLDHWFACSRIEPHRLTLPDPVRIFVR